MFYDRKFGIGNFSMKSENWKLSERWKIMQTIQAAIVFTAEEKFALDEIGSRSSLSIAFDSSSRSRQRVDRRWDFKLTLNDNSSSGHQSFVKKNCLEVKPRQKTVL